MLRFIIKMIVSFLILISNLFGIVTKLFVTIINLKKLHENKNHIPTYVLVTVAL